MNWQQRWVLGLGAIVFAGTAWHKLAAAEETEPTEEAWTDLSGGGESLDLWRAYQGEGVPPSWELRDGCIYCNGKDAAHLITRKKYADFELTGEWKISKAGNSGILLRVVEVTPWPATSGLEVQVIDHSDGWEEVHGSGLGLGQGAGALYGLFPAKESAIKKAGEWNTIRIVIEGSKIAIWQNGVALVDADMASEDWKARLGRSKFAGSDHFNKAPAGHIALQNYRGAGVWFRNLRIREIGSED